MEMKDLTVMDAAALASLLQERREELRVLRFRVRSAQEKNVRGILVARQAIARIQTVLSQKKAAVAPAATART